MSGGEVACNLAIFIVIGRVDILADGIWGRGFARRHADFYARQAALIRIRIFSA